jgi:hypothetical protein
LAPDVAMIDIPVAHLCDLCVLERHDTDRDLGRLVEVRTVERNRRHRRPPHAFAPFLR